MTGEPRPFTRVEPTPQSGEASVVIGWREADGAESVVLRMPLKSAIQALFEELSIVLTLLPTGIIVLNPEALPEGEVAALMADGPLPEAPLTTLINALLKQIAETPDASDAEDLERLAKDLERAARDVRDTLSRLKSSK